VRKFRQAAIAYFHYGVLYLFGAYALVERDLFPQARGPEWMWFSGGIAIGAVVVWGLWWWQNPWFASAVDVPPGLYLAAGLVVVANLGFLARAAWDL
jgi:hypothetical protein